MSDIDAFLSAYPRIHFACKSREVRSADRGVSLTPHHFQPTQEHLQFYTAHFIKKGAEAANAVRQILALDDGVRMLAAE